MKLFTTLIFIALAAPATAQTALSRAETEGIFSTFAFCHDLPGGGACDLLDVFSPKTGDAVEVIYTIPQGDHGLMYVETMTWRGEELCLSERGDDIQSIHRVDPDATGQADVAFNLSTAPPVDAAFVAAQRLQMTELRLNEMCLTVFGTRDGAGAVEEVQFRWNGGTTSVQATRLVPRAQGWLRITLQ